MGDKPEDPEARILAAIDYYHRNGYSDGQIISVLKNNGYDPVLVDKVFAQPKAEFKGTVLIPKKNRKLDLKQMVIGFLAICILGLALLFVWSVFFNGPLTRDLSQQLSSLFQLGNYSRTT